MLVTFSYRCHFDRTCPLLLFAEPLGSGRKWVSCNGLREGRSGRQHSWKRGVSEVCCYGWSVMRHPCLFFNLVFPESITGLLSSIFLIQKMWLIRWTSRAGWQGHSTDIQEIPSPVRMPGLVDYCVRNNMGRLGFVLSLDPLWKTQTSLLQNLSHVGKVISDTGVTTANSLPRQMLPQNLIN